MIDVKRSRLGELNMLADSYVEMRANEERIRRLVVKYQRVVLSQGHYTAEVLLEDDDPQRIVDPDQIYRLSADQWAKFDRDCDEWRAKLGLLVVNRYGCPLLEAAAMRVDAENQFLQAVMASPHLRSESRCADWTGERWLSKIERSLMLEAALRYVRLSAAECGSL